MATQCLGSTKTKNRCTKKVRHGNYCFWHRHQNSKDLITYKEDEQCVMADCPICFEPKEKNIKFSCKHSVCCDCIKELRQLLCPLCRTDISQDIPTQLKWVPPSDRFTEEQFRALQAQLPALPELIREYGSLDAVELYIGLLLSIGLPESRIGDLSFQ